MTRKFLRFGAAAAAALLGASLVAAAPDTAHNFVNQDLTWVKPPPRPPSPYMTFVQLVDTASARKSGDTVQFDELFLWNSPYYQTGMATPPPSSPTSDVRSRIQHYQVSCGWRTYRSPPPGLAPNLNDKPFAAFMLHDQFVSADWRENPLVDKICAGLPSGAPQGAKSIGEAIDFMQDRLATQIIKGGVPNTITVQSTATPPPPPPPAMDAGHPHRFTETYRDDGSMLFFDHADAARDGDSVTASALVVLGPETAESGISLAPVVALRKTRYDCADSSSTVLEQTFWNRYGEIMRGQTKTFGRRMADESPVTAADIQAACGGETAGAKSFTTVEDAWTEARSHWPPRVQPAWLSCAWNQVSEQLRAQYVSDWKSFTLQLIQHTHVGLPVPPTPEPSVVSACAVPDNRILPYAIGAYAMQRATLAMLSAQQIDEAKLRAAWDGIPWLERQRFAKLIQLRGPDDPQLRSDVVGRAADQLGIAPTDSVARTQIEDYFTGEARIEQ